MTKLSMNVTLEAITIWYERIGHVVIDAFAIMMSKANYGMRLGEKARRNG